MGRESRVPQMIILFSGLLFVIGLGLLYLALLLILLNIALRVLYVVLWVIAWVLRTALQPREPEVRIVLIENEEYEVYMKDVTPRSRLLT